jgi:MerR family transcriptional regulator, repressor of the yfmOP operon
MDVEWMKIDQMAKRSGLTKRTIRFYEEIGLLSSPKRTEGGVRLYSEDDLEELERVISAKELLGFSLQELQQFMETGKHLEMNKEGYLLSLDKRERKEKLEDIQRMLNEQMRMIDEKIEKFQSFKKRLEGMQAKAENALQSID